MEKFDKIIKNFVIPGLALAFVGLGIKECSNWEKTLYPIDTTPGISKIERVATSIDRGGILFSVDNSEKRRIVNFFDYGFNGTLDEVCIYKGPYNGEPCFYGIDLGKWIPDYEKVRNRLSGKRFIPLKEAYGK